jgi:hypothetical protein
MVSYMLRNNATTPHLNIIIPQQTSEPLFLPGGSPEPEPILRTPVDSPIPSPNMVRYENDYTDQFVLIEGPLSQSSASLPLPVSNGPTPIPSPSLVRRENSNTLGLY